MDRQDTLNSLKTNSPTVLIVGGGINGIGTFRDLSLQGVNTLLIDRGDFCSGASGASSRMAHGGIRYLENGEFRLVREAVQERNRMILNAPTLVKPLPTTIPIFKTFSGTLNAPLKFLGLLEKPSERGGLIIKVGLIFYDAFTGKNRAVPRHVFDGRSQALKKFPRLNPDIRYAATYYDGIILSPERLSIELLLDAEKEGDHARSINYITLTGVEDGSVTLQDEVSGTDFVVRPKLIINAAGPWIDRTNRMMGLTTQYVGPTKGSHLVLDNPELRQAINDHEFFFENKDGRIVLIFPLFDKVMIGTSDLPISDPDSARCTDEEVDYFIGLVGRVFPGIRSQPRADRFPVLGCEATRLYKSQKRRSDHARPSHPGRHTGKYPGLLAGGRQMDFFSGVLRAGNRQGTGIPKSRAQIQYKIPAHWRGERFPANKNRTAILT